MFSSVVVCRLTVKRCTSCEIVSSPAASVSRTSCHQVFPLSSYIVGWFACWTQAQKGPGSNCRVTVLGKLFTPIVSLFTKQQNCLTAKNRDHLRNLTLGNRVWATFTFYLHCNSCYLVSHTSCLQVFPLSSYIVSNSCYLVCRWFLELPA